MILTGSEIAHQISLGSISIEDFDSRQLNPNSYNYRLGPLILRYEGEQWIRETIPATGYKLEPHRLYLGHTLERIGSSAFATSLIGRSSVGRLGLFVQAAANLGHTGTYHSWTLEMIAARPILVYPRMKIGQVSFWVNQGSVKPYAQGYSLYDVPMTSKDTTQQRMKL